MDYIYSSKIPLVRTVKIQVNSLLFYNARWRPSISYTPPKLNGWGPKCRQHSFSTKLSPLHTVLLCIFVCVYYVMIGGDGD